MWVDRVPATTSCFPYTDDNLSVQVPTLLTSLFDNKRVIKSDKTTNSPSSPYHTEDAVYYSRILSKQMPEKFNRKINKIQPINSQFPNSSSTVFRLSSQNDIVPFQCVSNKNQHDSHRNNQPSTLKKQFPSPTLTKHLNKLPRNNKKVRFNQYAINDALSFYPLRNIKLSPRQYVSHFNVQRRYRCLAIEILKIWISRYHTTLKRVFLILLSYRPLSFPHTAPFPLYSANGLNHSKSLFLKDKPRQKLMACIFLKHLLVLMVKITFHDVQKQCFYNLKSIPNDCISSQERSFSSQPFSNFQAFQLERGCCCMENVLLRVMFRELRSIPTASFQWSTIRPIIQELTDLAEHHLNTYYENEILSVSTKLRGKKTEVRYNTAISAEHSVQSCCAPTLLKTEPSPTGSLNTKDIMFGTQDQLCESTSRCSSSRLSPSYAPRVTCAEFLTKNQTLFSPESFRFGLGVPLYETNLGSTQKETLPYMEPQKKKKIETPEELASLTRKSLLFRETSNYETSNKLSRTLSLEHHDASDYGLSSTTNFSVLHDTNKHVALTQTMTLKQDPLAQKNSLTPTCPMQTPHFLNTFRSPPETQPYPISDSSITPYSIIQELVQGSFFIKYSRKRGRPSRRFVWIDLPNGLLCWAASTPDNTPSTPLSFMKNSPTPNHSDIKRKTSQNLSRDESFSAIHVEKKSSFMGVSRCHSTFGASALTNAPSFMAGCNAKVHQKPLGGTGSQNASLSQIQKIAYTWIHSPRSAVSLIRKDIMLQPSDGVRGSQNKDAKDLATQSSHVPKTVFCLTFLIIFRATPLQSRSFLTNKRFSSIFSKSSSAKALESSRFLQFTCFNEKQLYTWLIGLQLLASSYNITYPSLHFSYRLQNKLASLCLNSTANKESYEILIRFRARLRWIKACRHIRSLYSHWFRTSLNKL